MQRATLSLCMYTYVIEVEGCQVQLPLLWIHPPAAMRARTHPGWMSMLQVEPTATPPASVAFWTSTMEKCPRRRLERRKVATQLPGCWWVE